MTQTGTRTQIETPPLPGHEAVHLEEQEERIASEMLFTRLRLLWEKRGRIYRATVVGLVFGTLLAFAIPKQYESTTQLMPPDSQSSSGMAMVAALTAKATGGLGTGGLGTLAGDMLGIKSSGALFVGILRSRTVQDGLVEKFDLKKVYWVSLDEKARKKLSENTYIFEDRKSGILTITVTDHDPQRAAALAQAYVLELNRLVAQVSTSSARREREFLEERLKSVQIDLENAEKDFSQFASKNSTIDIKEQGKAMVEAAATLEGQLIAAKSQLEGLRQIYTDNNVRVRAAQARVSELQIELNKIGGKGENTSPAGDVQSDQLYPSIRKLPILGVTYADLYRRTRVQEAVFEALTQQYELAKVQEAKETPSVKVLDDARIPERKSFPPRLIIMLTSTFLAFLAAALILLGQARWEAVDETHKGKVLATEILTTVNGHMPWATPNGSRLQAASHRIWMRLVPRNGSTSPEDEVEK
jgi:capsule polysaccharide export protein KpsE/RkpR